MAATALFFGSGVANVFVLDAVAGVELLFVEAAAAEAVDVLFVVDAAVVDVAGFLESAAGMLFYSLIFSEVFKLSSS